MAQFYGTIQGNRSEASRLSTKASGLTAQVNGWDIGVRVEAGHYNGEDQVSVIITGGSHDCITSKFIGTFVRKGDKIVQKL